MPQFNSEIREQGILKNIENTKIEFRFKQSAHLNLKRKFANYNGKWARQDSRWAKEEVGMVSRGRGKLMVKGTNILVFDCEIGKLEISENFSFSGGHRWRVLRIKKYWG